MDRTERTDRLERIETDRKLQLIHDIRLQNQQNRIKCRERERFLYGSSAVDFRETQCELHSAEAGVLSGRVDRAECIDRTGRSTGSFKIRMILAIILFCGFIFLEQSGMELGGKTAEDIYHMMMEDMEINGR